MKGIIPLPLAKNRKIREQMKWEENFGKFHHEHILQGI